MAAIRQRPEYSPEREETESRIDSCRWFMDTVLSCSYLHGLSYKRYERYQSKRRQSSHVIANAVRKPVSTRCRPTVIATLLAIGGPGCIKSANGHLPPELTSVSSFLQVELYSPQPTGSLMTRSKAVCVLSIVSCSPVLPADHAPTRPANCWLQYAQAGCICGSQERNGSFGWCQIGSYHIGAISMMTKRLAPAFHSVVKDTK